MSLTARLTSQHWIFTSEITRVVFNNCKLVAKITEQPVKMAAVTQNHITQFQAHFVPNVSKHIKALIQLPPDLHMLQI